MQTDPKQNPILKAHLEGVEMFKKEFITSHPGDSGIGGNDPQETVYELNIDFQEPFEEVKRFKSFLTTYAEMILNAAKEAGPGEKTWPIWGRDTAPAEGDTTSKKDRNKGFNDCRSSFHSAIDDGIKEIKNN